PDRARLRAPPHPAFRGGPGALRAARRGNDDVCGSTAEVRSGRTAAQPPRDEAAVPGRSRYRRAVAEHGAAAHQRVHDAPAEGPARMDGVAGRGEHAVRIDRRPALEVDDAEIRVG